MTGTELKKLRENSDTTQTELAIHLGYSVGGEPNRSMISRFELGYAKINPRIERLCKDYFKQKQESKKAWEKVA